MLRSLKALDGFKIAATDGELGHVRDIYFDDRKWTVRYFEVDTGGWLSGRMVLLSTAVVSGIDWDDDLLRVNLTRQQVQDSPGLDSALPVSRQHELALSRYYGTPHYWQGPFLWGYTGFPSMVDPIPWDPNTDQLAGTPVDEQAAEGDPHLRTKDEVIGYQIEARDGGIGHMEDLLFNQDDWRIALVVVATRDWLPGRHVLISPAAISNVSWEEKSVQVSASRKEIETSPEYDTRRPPDISEVAVYTQSTWSEERREDGRDMRL
jgi:uncharacterized protein YrrD